MILPPIWNKMVEDKGEWQGVVKLKSQQNTTTIITVAFKIKSRRGTDRNRQDLNVMAWRSHALLIMKKEKMRHTYSTAVFAFKMESSGGTCLLNIGQRLHLHLQERMTLRPWHKILLQSQGNPPLRCFPRHVTKTGKSTSAPLSKIFNVKS